MSIDHLFPGRFRDDVFLSVVSLADYALLHDRCSQAFLFNAHFLGSFSLPFFIGPPWAWVLGLSLRTLGLKIKPSLVLGFYSRSQKTLFLFIPP